MLRIGEFAWLGNVTVETLQHYDRIGLLKPADVTRLQGIALTRSNSCPGSTGFLR